MVDVAVPGDPGVLPGRRIQQCRVLAGLARCQWPVGGLAAAPLNRLLAPTTAYLVVVLAVVLALDLSEVDGAHIEYGAWAAVFHLWFLPAYLVLVAATPALLAAHRRWAWAVLAGFAVLVAIVDTATLGGRLGQLGSVNYLLGWATVYQLGIVWRAHWVAGGRSPWRLSV